MKLIQMFLGAATTLALFNCCGAEIYTDIQSMMNVWDSTAPTIAYHFALTGTVHSAGSSSSFTIDDGNLIIPVLNRTNPPVPLQAGNRVAISGNFGLKKYAYGNEPYTVALEARVLETGTSPLPTEKSLKDLSSSKDNLRFVRTSGTVIDYRVDDADPDYLRLILKDGATIIPVSVCTRDAHSVDLLMDAQVSVVGTFHRTQQGVRRYSSPSIDADLPNLLVTTPPPATEDIPVLERKIYLTPNDILSLGKRKVSGEIIAVWQKHNLLLQDDDRRIVRVRLSQRNHTAPQAGQRATVCGYPETDQFNIILNSSTIASVDTGVPAAKDPERLASPSAVITQTAEGSSIFQPAYYGRLVTLRGTVRNLMPSGNAEGRIGLESNGHLVQLDASSCPEASDGLELGCTVEATGVCLFEMNDYSVQTEMPSVSGLTLILRGKDDITIFSRPPWLTPMRFLVILAAMAGVLVLILIWNASLRILVERRGRELARREAQTLKARLKTAERTRLATELHDAVVQNLTGAALEIRAAMAALDGSDSESAPHLDIALKTINSSRQELRNCIWDLRNRALEEKDIDEAIRITLQPHLGNAKIQIRFNVSRRKIPDSEFHNIISIIRELVVNAVRHGHAKSIKVAGTLDRGRILFSVTDDGCGFDPKSAPGMEQGHFGIEGVSERAKSLDGTAAIDSTPGKGTRVSVNVALLEEAS